MKKALVISGGGSKGAFAGGVAEYLIKEKKRDYDLYLGTSTGSLLIPLLALGEIERIKEVYTSIDQKKIFNKNPFGITKIEEKYKVHISYLGLIRRIIFEKPTFGETHNLRKLIERTFTKDHYDRLRASGKEVIITVSNLSTEKVEYKSTNKYGYDDMCDWLWASANYLPFMSLVDKNGDFYGDGGFGNYLPLVEALRNGATEVDIIFLLSEVRSRAEKGKMNILKVSSSVINFMTTQIALDDLMMGEMMAQSKGVKLNKYMVPRQLTGDPLIFDKKRMQEWWEEGIEYARLTDKSLD